MIFSRSLQPFIVSAVFGVVLPTTKRTHDMKLKKAFLHGIGFLCLTCLASAQDAPKGPPPEGGSPGGPPGGRPQGGPPGGGEGGNRLAEFIKRADTDADGKISKEEFANLGKKESEDRFSKMDANSDGFVDQQEIGAMAQRMQGQGGQGMRRPEGGPPGGGEGGGFRRPPGGEGGPRPEGSPQGGPRPEGQGMRPGGEGGQRGEGGPRGGGMFGDPKEGFKRMDADGNGSISEDEFIKATEKMREMIRNRGGMPGGQLGQPGQPGGQGGFRRPEGQGGPPGGAPGGEGGFRRPPTEGDAPKDAPKEAPAPDKPKDAA